MAPLGTMWPDRSKGWGAAGGRSPRSLLCLSGGAAVLLLGGEVIEAVALSLESELLSSLGHLEGLTGPCAGLGWFYRNGPYWEGGCSL